MSVDVKCHTFAQLWLRAGGWTNDMDTMKLAQLVQDIAEDFVTELEEGIDHDQSRT